MYSIIFCVLFRWVVVAGSYTDYHEEVGRTNNVG